MEQTFLPHLILIAGLPGTGKSSVARAFVQRYGGVHINSDLLRNDMGLRGHYGSDDKKLVYQAMLAHTRKALLEGQIAVVDSTFILESTRTPFEEVARACQVAFFWVEMHASEDSLRERLMRPRSDSEADFSVFLSLRAQHEPIDRPHLELWSDKMALEDMVECIRNYTLKTSL